MIAVMVVDDDFRVARIHSAFVDRVEGFRTVGVAANGAEALAMARRLGPDLILLDLYLPDVFGLDLINQMRVAGVEGDVIVISAANESETVERALKLDANSAEAHWARGEINEALGRAELAVADLRKALALDPRLKPAARALDRLGVGTRTTESAPHVSVQV